MFLLNASDPPKKKIMNGRCQLGGCGALAVLDVREERERDSEVIRHGPKRDLQRFPDLRDGSGELHRRGCLASEVGLSLDLGPRVASRNFVCCAGHEGNISRKS